MRDLRLSERFRRIATTDGLMIALLTLAGPFGTYEDLSAPWRLVYWAAAVGGCGAMFHLIANTVVSARRLPSWPRPPRVGLAAILAGIPGAAFISLLEAIVRGEQTLDHYRLLWYWLCVAVICVMMGVVHYIVLEPRRQAVDRNGEAGAPRPPTAPFLDRLPAEYGRDLVSLSMQDHYVRATTCRGSTMILIRFADALQELVGFRGTQVHRSHWVAASHARRLVRTGKKTAIELSDGRQLPVSRPYLDDARLLVDWTRGNPSRARTEEDSVPDAIGLPSRRKAERGVGSF